MSKDSHKPKYFNFEDKDNKNEWKTTKGVKSPFYTDYQHEKVKRLSRIRSAIKSMDYPWNDAINKPYPVFKVTSPTSNSQKIFKSRYTNQN